VGSDDREALVVNIPVDTSQVGLGVRVLERLGKDQGPFALSLTINALALTFQKEQRGHQARTFTIRRKTFVDRAVKLKPKATKRRPEATVSIDPPGGQARADILSKFEDQTKKTPIRGRTLAVPGPGVRRGKTGVITKASKISAFDFREISPRVAIGKKRTFLLRTGPRRGYIFQRKGRKGSTRVELLYTLVPQVPIRPELDFVQNAVTVVRRDTAREYGRALDYALRTAK
jgi:hypothetical protein